MIKEKSFKKWAIFVLFILISMVISTPISQSYVADTIQPNTLGADNNDFSIIIHRIRQEDEIDPLSEADWQLRMYVNDVKITYECDGDDVYIDETFTWQDILTEGMEFVYVKMELLELDTWPNEHDIADISACVDPDYEEGDYDDTTNFNAHRPAVFKRTFNLTSKDWEPVDDDNDFLNTEGTPPVIWFITSGNYDGSTTIDENDATIWFNVMAGNTAPYPPEKPTGETFGWIDITYDFSTKGSDPDGDQVQFGWDWDNDNVVDEITDFYDQWQTCTTPHSWEHGQIYYIKVLAIDTEGAVSEWSDSIKIRINAPGGINGVDIYEWSLGHVYCQYFNHTNTDQIIDIFEDGTNVIAALSVVIAAIATACGVPFPYDIIFTIATAMVRLGIEIIKLLDVGMGIYLKIFVVELAGIPISSFGYIWSQTDVGQEGMAPAGNECPDKPSIPSGPTNIEIGGKYYYSSATTDPNNDRVTYVFDWGDGNFSCSDLIESGETAEISHIWEEKGSYNIKVKSLDEWGFESQWSDPLTISVTKTRQRSKPLFVNLFDRIIDIFPQLSTLLKLFI